MNEGMGGGVYYECELLFALGIKQQAWRDVVEGLMGKKREVPPLIRSKIPSAVFAFSCFPCSSFFFRCNSAESEWGPFLG